MDNPPAFPSNYLPKGIWRQGGVTTEVTVEQPKGMTLLDYFAAHATDEDVKDMIISSGQPLTRQEARYWFAKIMLREREKGQAKAP